MAWFKKIKLKRAAKKISLTLIIFCSLLVLVIFYLINSHKHNQNYQKLEIRGQELLIEIADKPEEHYRGLSNRPSLCKNCGLLFIFPNKQARQFVMRNMLFPLDIIFINDNQIVKIFKNLPPEGSQPKNIYSSFSAVDKVLEINGGQADDWGLIIGDQIILK